MKSKEIKSQNIPLGNTENLKDKKTKDQPSEKVMCQDTKKKALEKVLSNLNITKDQCPKVDTTTENSIPDNNDMTELSAGRSKVVHEVNCKLETEVTDQKNLNSIGKIPEKVSHGNDGAVKDELKTESVRDLNWTYIPVMNYKQYIKFKRPEVEEGGRRYRKCVNKEKIRKYLDLIREGKMSKQEVAKIANVALSTVSAWITADNKIKKAMMNENAGIQSKHPRYKRDLTEEQLSFIETMFKNNESMSLINVAKELKKRYADCEISYSTLYQRVYQMHTIGLPLAYYSTRSKMDQDVIKNRHNWIMKYINSDIDFKLNCVFIDIQSISRKKVDSDQKMETTDKTQYVFAYSHKGIINLERIVRENESSLRIEKNQEYITGFIRRTLDQLNDIKDFKPVYIIWSPNFQKFKKAEEIMIEAGYKFNYLPDHSPCISPGNVFWLQLKKRMTGLSACRNNIHLPERVMLALYSIRFEDIDTILNGIIEEIYKESSD